MSQQAQYAIEHRAAFATIGLTFQLLDQQAEVLERLVRSADRMMSVGIVLDPTLLRDYLQSENANAQVDMARLVLRFVRELRSKIDALPKEPLPRPGQGEDALGEVVQEFPGGDSRAAGAANTGGRGG